MAKSIAIVSAIGADKNSYNLYLKQGQYGKSYKKIGYSKTIFLTKPLAWQKSKRIIQT